MIQKRIPFLVLLILLSSYAYAVNIITEPEELIFENVLNNGYAEKILKVKSDSPEPTEVVISTSDLIHPWIKSEPRSAYVTNSSFTEFKVMIRPTEAFLGVYEGFLIINAFPSGNQITSVVSSAKTLKTTVEVTDQEIMQAEIEDVSVPATEEKSPIRASVTVQNQGNIAISPLFKINVLDASKNQILKSDNSEKRTLLPYSTDIIELSMPNDLPLGTYWAKVTTYLDDSWVLSKRLIRFDVVEQGTLPIKKPVILETEVIPLSSSWSILLMWFAILVFIIWVIARKRSFEKDWKK